MPAYNLSYKIHTPRQSQQGKKWIQRERSVKLWPKFSFVGSVIVAYAIVAAFLGYAIFSGFRNQGQASPESAFVSASLRLIEKDVYKVGSQVEAVITIQNTSIFEPINNLNVEFKSTQNSVSWQKAVLNTNSFRPKEIQPLGNVFTISLLSAGERTEYTVFGVLTNDDFEFLTLVASLTFKNREGVQNTSTNRVFTKVKSSLNKNNLLNLEANKTNFKKDEKINLKLSTTDKNDQPDLLSPSVKGKIFVSQKETGEVVASLTCQLGIQSECLTTLEKVNPGNYTALFISDDEQVFSRIIQFAVEGVNNQFKPSDLASLNLPFNNQSINGLVPVIAKQVMSLNDFPKGEKCTFEIFKDEKLVASVEAIVQRDRTCKTVLDDSSFKEGSGVYQIRLKNTSKSAQVLFLPKSNNLIPVQLVNSNLSVGSSVQILANNILDLNNLPNFYNGNATLGIWHPNSGDFKEITNFGGIPIQVVNGQLFLNIPGSEFPRGGFYSIFIKLADGRYSDFVGLTFNDQSIGFALSGVIVENSEVIRVGQELKLKLENILDRSGSLVKEAECGVNFYQTNSGPVPIVEKGKITDGVCKITVPKGKLTKSGPLLVTFFGENLTNPINQSRQLYLSPGVPDTYGFLGLEYEPAVKNYANNFIIGPVTDAYGNLTYASDLKLQIFDLTRQTVAKLEEEDQAIDLVVEVEPRLIADYPVTIDNGFAKIIAPSSLFNLEKMKLVLLSPDNKILKEKIVEVVQLKDQQTLTFPNLPNYLNSDNKLKLGIGNLDSGIEECKLSYFKSQNSVSEIRSPMDIETNSCQFDWNLNQNRDNGYGLIQLQVGDKLFNQIVKHISGEPNSLFVLAPQVRVNERDEIELELLTSPITDINGRPVEKGVIKWQINGRSEETIVLNGFSKLSIKANKLTSQDLRKILDQKFLDLSLDVRAGISSVSRTKSLSIYLGNRDITLNTPEFGIQKANSQITFNQKQIFKFKTRFCNASLLSETGVKSNLLTHWQGDSCYVEVGGNLGTNTILFEENGFDLGSFTYTVALDKISVTWCAENPCKIQVFSQNQGGIEAIVYDGEKQYRFEANSLENEIQISQNGVNPLKNYLVEVILVKNDKTKISLFREISGDLLQLKTQA